MIKQLILLLSKEKVYILHQLRRPLDLIVLHSGHLIGPQRFFDSETSSLLNLTDSRTGTIYFKEWALEEKLVSIFGCQETNLGKRCMVNTKRSMLFEEMISCIFVTEDFFVNCYKLIDFSEINVNDCQVSFHMSNEKIGSNETFNMMVSTEEIIEKRSMKSSLKCSSSLSTWLEHVENPKLFWYHFNENDEPLNINNPLIELEIQFLKGRSGWESKKVTIESQSGKIILFEGTINDGKLEGTVDSKLANHPAWRSRLIIGIHNSESDYSRTSREHLTRSLDYYVKENNEEKQKDKFKKYEQFVVGSFKDGKLHGLVQIFGKMTVDPKGHLSSTLFEGLNFLGWFEKGKPVGPCWKFLVGGTYIYGMVDENGEFTGPNIAFIYQDQELALVGEFKDGVMVRFK